MNNTQSESSQSSLSSKSKEDENKKFNLQFDKLKADSKEKYKKNQEDRLLKLNSEANIPSDVPFYKKNIGQLFIGIKDTWFEILDDILDKQFSLKIFTKGNRLFFIGLTICIIGFILVLYDMFMNPSEDNTEKKKVEIHHVYHIDPKSMPTNDGVVKSIIDNAVA